MDIHNDGKVGRLPSQIQRLIGQSQEILKYTGTTAFQSYKSLLEYDIHRAC